jgi:RNA polymerase sigma factor (sigma-70 family)
MATGKLSGVAGHVHKAEPLKDSAGLTDGQLLKSFLAWREQAAFEALVQRHGPMVLGVCLRILRNAHDADDAFQATFLVLVRKAVSLQRRETLGNWLYGVAYRTALKARAAIAKRRAKEAQVRDLAKPEATMKDTWHEWRSLLDQELSRLPAKYREAIVLCHLQGKTRGQAAWQLGIPAGTLSGRLTTARRMLARRLTRRGVAVSSGLLAGLCPNVASAHVPWSLLLSTIRGAMLLSVGQTGAGAISAEVAALTEGVVKAMFMAHVKVLTVVVLAVGVAAVGAGMLTMQMVRVWGTEPQQREERAEQIRQELAKSRGHVAPQWYTNSQGQTMVVLPRSVKFRMGSRLAAAINVWGEELHRRRIKPLFAIATTPVTRQQFLCFRPEFSHNEMGRYPDPTCPTGGVTWYEAAAYSNWLSKQEGLPDTDSCYEPNPQNQLAYVISKTELKELLSQIGSKDQARVYRDSQLGSPRPFREPRGQPGPRP